MRRRTVVWTCVGVIKWLPVSVACKNHFLKRQIQALKRGHFCVFQDPAPASAPAPERRPGPGARSHPLRQSASIFILFQLVLAVHKTVFNMSCCLFPLLFLLAALFMPNVSDLHGTDTNTGPLKCHSGAMRSGAERKPSVGQADLNRYGLPATTHTLTPPNIYIFAYTRTPHHTYTYLNKTFSHRPGQRRTLRNHRLRHWRKRERRRGQSRGSFPLQFSHLATNAGHTGRGGDDWLKQLPLISHSFGEEKHIKAVAGPQKTRKA